MGNQTEDRVKAIEDILGATFAYEAKRELLSQLWEWTADDWERGVMYGGGIGTIRPHRPNNPYQRPENPCNAPLNIKGEGFNCDKGWGHALPHGNTEAGAIWDGEQPPTDSLEPTPEPPLVLPNVPSVIRATVNGTGRLLYGPLRNGIDKDWCDADNGYAVLAQDIQSFEVLWTEGERGKDALVSWELIDKLRDAYPSDPGAYMTPVDYFLREVVMDR